MSVIQRIRDKGAWIIFGIIALALIAFILQDGMRRGGKAFSNSSTIGKVNGEVITRLDFEEKLTAQERMYAQQGAQRDQLIGGVWNQEVDKIVLGQQYEKLGLQVSSKEMSDILFGENSPLRQQFTDPKTGEFRVNDARQAIANLKKSKNTDQINAANSQLIDPAVNQALRMKYQNLLIQAAYIPKWMAAKQVADNAAVASFSYVYVPYAAVNDTTKISDDEINAYVKKHSKEYSKTEETRNIGYVTFSAAPNGADSASALAQINAAKAEFSTTGASDMEAFLSKNGSETPFYNSYFSKARMQQPNKDSLVKIPVGSVMGPYLDGSNYVLAKMLGTAQWPDSAKVRHILISTQDPRSGQEIRPDTTAKKLADSIAAAIKGGADFAALAAKYSDDPGSKDKGGVYDYFPQGQMVIPFNDFAFGKPNGTKEVVKTDLGYHYIEILGQKGSATAYKIAYFAKGIKTSNETDNAASTAAAQFSVSSKSPKAFTDNAIKLGKQAIPASNIKANDFNIMGVGQNRQMIRWIYDNKVGDVSDPFQVGDQYVVVMVTSVNPEGLMSAAEARPTVEALVRNEKKAKQIIETKFKGNTLEAYAASTGAAILRADSLTFSAPIISGVGSEPKIIGAVFNKNVSGKASEPIAGATGVFAIKTEMTGTKQIAVDPEAARANLVQGVKMSAYRSVEALRKAATIKDYRSKFY